MTESIDVTPKTTKQNLVVRIGKSEAEVTTFNNKKKLRSRYCTVEAAYTLFKKTPTFVFLHNS